MTGKPTVGQSNWGTQLNAYLDELDAAAVKSDVVDTLDVSGTLPVTVPAGTVWIPSTDWLETHEHPENQLAVALAGRATFYQQLWYSAAVTTLNLGAFSGALFGRLNLAPFVWSETSALFQSFHAEVTTVGTGVVRFGIYKWDADLQALAASAPLIDLGTIDSTVLGVQNIVTNYTLTRGVYALAYVWQGTSTTGPVLRARTPDLSGILQHPGATTIDLSGTKRSIYPANIASVTGALPAATSAWLYASDDTVVPSVALRRS